MSLRTRGCLGGVGLFKLTLSTTGNQKAQDLKSWAFCFVDSQVNFVDNRSETKQGKP